MSIADDCVREVEGLTVPSLLHRNASEFGDLPALTPVGRPMESLTWGGLRAEAAALSRGLRELGLRAGDRMLILMFARPEHWVADLAGACLGAVTCTLYDTLSPDQLAFIARHSGAPVIVLEGAEQVARWDLDGLPDVRHVLVLDESAVPSDPRFLSLSDVRERGRALHEADPSVFEAGWRAIPPEAPVCLLYTSGTTGDPKGVALSHRNVIYQGVTLQRLVPTPDHSPSVSYLPLAHIAERELGIYIPLYRAGHVHICADPAQLVPALAAVRPLSFFGVPRVWEKMAAGLHGLAGALPAEQRSAYDAAHAARLSAYRLRSAGVPVPASLAAEVEAGDAVLAPIRRMFGLDRVIWAGSGAAPIPVEVLWTLAGVGIEILEVWGMTETTGTATLNLPDAVRPGTVGRPNAGMEVRLAADGEVLVRGPLVCLGYLRPDGTVEDPTDADGWLATGDVGALDEDGYLSITDRKKELIITSSGKNIPPTRIESLLRAHPLIAQAVAIGDRRPYVTALIVLDPDTAPGWAKLHGVEAGDLTSDPVMLAELQAAVNAANTELARIEQVKRFHVMPTPWTPHTGELTPKLSLRRRVITDRYADLIDALYA